MSVKDKSSILYDHSPIWAQNAAVSAYGWLLKRERYGGTYREALTELVNHDRSDPERERAYQNDRFLKLVRHALEHSPFYQGFYKDVDLSAVRSVEDIGRLPVLAKETLKKNLLRVYTIDPRNACRSYTGGTTGTPMMSLFRPEDFQRRMAYLDAYKLRFGFVNNEMRSARFFGRNVVPVGQKEKIFWRDNRPSKQRFYSSYFLTPENLPCYVENLNAFKPDEVDGFVSAIYEVARFILKRGVRLTFSPKAVFVTSETVLPHHRPAIEAAFGCPMSDQYASSEGAPFITQCRFGRYHENIDTGVFEHLDDGAGGKKLVVTSFDSYGTPLIRYDIGDGIVESKETGCPCGLAHPMIERIEGRSSDALWLPDGRRIGAAQLSTLVSEMPAEVLQVQFAQNADKSIRLFACLGGGNETAVRKIRDAMDRYFGRSVRVEIVPVDRIAREKSGKFRLIRNA